MLIKPRLAMRGLDVTLSLPPVNGGWTRTLGEYLYSSSSRWHLTLFDMKIDSESFAETIRMNRLTRVFTLCTNNEDPIVKRGLFPSRHWQCSIKCVLIHKSIRSVIYGLPVQLTMCFLTFSHLPSSMPRQLATFKHIKSIGLFCQSSAGINYRVEVRTEDP